MRLIQSIKPQILEELNIEDLKWVEDFSGINQDKYTIVSDGERSYAVTKKEEIPPEFLAEGLAREIVHQLQNMRRSAGFDIADHITTYYDGDSYVKQVMQDWADYIKQETLSRELVGSTPEGDAFTADSRLSGHEIRLGVKRTD